MRALILVVGVAALFLLTHCLLIFRGGPVPAELVWTGVVLSVGSAVLVGFAAATLLWRKD